MELSAPKSLIMVVLLSILGPDVRYTNDAPSHERCDSLRMAASLRIGRPLKS